MPKIANLFLDFCSPVIHYITYTTYLSEGLTVNDKSQRKVKKTMARLTPEQAQEKHARRLKGSIEDIRLGVERVTTSPTQLAAAKQDKMKMRLLASIDSGKWSAGLKRVSLDE